MGEKISWARAEQRCLACVYIRKKKKASQSRHSLCYQKWWHWHCSLCFVCDGLAVVCRAVVSLPLSCLVCSAYECCRPRASLCLTSLQRTKPEIQAPSLLPSCRWRGIWSWMPFLLSSVCLYRAVRSWGRWQVPGWINSPFNLLTRQWPDLGICIGKFIYKAVWGLMKAHSKETRASLPELKCHMRRISGGEPKPP